MRALQAGFEIVVGEVTHASRGVDTEDDLREVRRILGERGVGVGWPGEAG